MKIKFKPQSISIKYLRFISSQVFKKANFNRNSLFTNLISINLYLSSSARYLRYTERLYGQMRRILL